MQRHAAPLFQFLHDFIEKSAGEDGGCHEWDQKGCPAFHAAGDTDRWDRQYPACLKSLPTGSVNGALWTVFTEVQLYLVLGMLYPFLQKMKDRHWAAFLSVLAVLNLGCAAAVRDADGIAAKWIERLFIPYALWFFIGVFCFQRRHKMLPVYKESFLPMLCIYLILKSVPMRIPGYYADIITSVMIPFMVIGCGYFLPEIRLKQDLSYGIFLYHWIILNIMAHYELMDRMPWYAGLLLFFAGTMAAAGVSRALYVCGGRIWWKWKAERGY